MRKRIINYLSITRKEWNGLVVVVIIILAITASPYVYQYYHKDTPINLKDFNKALMQLHASGNNDTADIAPADSDKKTDNPVAFPFNPNTATTMQWQQLGLSLRQALAIQHYRDKGGRFFTRADVKKMYTLTVADYLRLGPYIVLPALQRKRVIKNPIELNSATAAALTTLNGIGPAYAARIISYRDRLGGFISVQQLKEIYGIDTALFNSIRGQVTADASKIRRLPVNTISVNQLRIFPYLKYNEANAIIEYRVQHGPYNGFSDLSHVVILSTAVLEKIKPYISF